MTASFLRPKLFLISRLPVGSSRADLVSKMAAWKQSVEERKFSRMGRESHTPLARRILATLQTQPRQAGATTFVQVVHGLIQNELHARNRQNRLPSPSQLVPRVVEQLTKEFRRSRLEATHWKARLTLALQQSCPGWAQVKALAHHLVQQGKHHHLSKSRRPPRQVLWCQRNLPSEI